MKPNHISENGQTILDARMLTEIENIFVMISGSTAKTFKQPDHQIQLLYIVCYLPLLE